MRCKLLRTALCITLKHGFWQGPFAALFQQGMEEDIARHAAWSLAGELSWLGRGDACGWFPGLTACVCGTRCCLMSLRSEDEDSNLEEAPSGGLLALALGASPPPHSALEWPAGDEPFSRGSSFAALQAEEARAGPVMSGAHGTALVRVHAAACLPRLAACRRPHAAAHRAAQDIHCLRVHLWCTFHALYFALCERSTRYLFQIVAPCLAPCLVPCSACM